MKWATLPFNITIFSSVLPWILLVFTDNRAAIYIPDGMSVLAMYLLVLFSPSRIILRHKTIFLYLSIITYLAVTIISKIGVGSGGTVAVMVLTYIFLTLMKANPESLSPKYILKKIGYIYILHVVFILFELVVRLSHNSELFLSVSDANDIKIYKMYNSAAFIKYLGIDGVSGMNGLLLGSQGASMVVLYSVFYFYIVSKSTVLFKSEKNIYLLFTIISLITFPFVATMTSTLILLVMLLMAIYVIPIKGFNKIYIKIIFPIFMITLSPYLIGLLFFRINNLKDFNVYIEAFMSSIYGFYNLPLINMFLGYGSEVVNRKKLIDAADFGFGMILFQGGIIILFLAILSLALIMLSSVKSLRKEKLYSQFSNPWTTILGVNLLCSIGWFFSLVHYTTAIELGGRQLFSLHLAISILSINKLKSRPFSSLIPIPRIIKNLPLR